MDSIVLSAQLWCCLPQTAVVVSNGRSSRAGRNAWPYSGGGVWVSLLFKNESTTMSLTVSLLSRLLSLTSYSAAARLPKTAWNVFDRLICSTLPGIHFKKDVVAPSQMHAST
ncbi:hypothetical protein BDZ89DRAFT_398104 [Hymenopellis radicata]|nr:hypothetical protein BDZ89DRAFT_398104 [Hymenopellis radicata]